MIAAGSGCVGARIITDPAEFNMLVLLNNIILIKPWSVLMHGLMQSSAYACQRVGARIITDPADKHKPNFALNHALRHSRALLILYYAYSVE
jgi:hypothetical protein